MFFRILKDAVDYMMVNYEYKGNGRPPAYYGDIVKSLCIKSYHNYSSWRLKSELKIANAMGIIDEVHGKSTLNKYLQSKKVTQILQNLYKLIAEPLFELETQFSPDATGISNKYGNVRWMNIRHTKKEAKHRREYSKLHVIIGDKTNVICSAKITKGTQHENPLLKSLLNDMDKGWNIKEINADAGYLSKENVKAICNIGAKPFIMGKKNVHVSRKGPASDWNTMLRMIKDNQMYFYEHYHQRSNVEATFSSFKRKFADFCRCKKPESQENEILSRVVCYNATILNKALLNYDLEGGFING